MTDWLDGVRLRLSVVPRALWVWLGWGALGGGLEVYGVLTHTPEVTLSFQVWWLMWAGPDWLNVVSAVAFGGIMGILTLHFFGDR